MNREELSEKLKALGDVQRLEILELLQGGSQSASALLEHLEIGQSTLSHHMQQLCKAGFVSARRDGKWTYYAINPDAVWRCADQISRLSYVRRSNTPASLPTALL